MSERTFYEEGDPNAPPPKKFQMTPDGRVVLDEGALRANIQQIREALQSEMVIKSLDKGRYPWVQADGVLAPDNVYEEKKHVFLYQIGSELGLSAAKAEQELTLEHLAELSEDQQVSFPLECSQDLAESQMMGSAVPMVYKNAVKGKRVINEKIVLNRSRMPHQPSFETRLFRVKYGDRDMWYTYSKNGELKPYMGKVVVSDKGRDATSDKIRFLELNEPAAELQKLFGKVSIQDFKKELLATSGFQASDIKRIDIPEMDMSQGGLIRLQLQNGAFEWVYCPPEMFGLQDEGALLREHLKRRREAKQGSASEKPVSEGLGKRILGGVQSRINKLLGRG
jgi:hypothetical protein